MILRLESVSPIIQKLTICHRIPNRPTSPYNRSSRRYTHRFKSPPPPSLNKWDILNPLSSRSFTGKAYDSLPLRLHESRVNSSAAAGLTFHIDNLLHPNPQSKRAPWPDSAKQGQFRPSKQQLGYCLPHLLTKRFRCVGPARGATHIRVYPSSNALAGEHDAYPSL